jgi:hypothetical protein
VTEGETPIAWAALRRGTPVIASDGTELGKVADVIAYEQKDIFSGLSVDPGWFKDERFVPADLIDRSKELRKALWEQGLELFTKLRRNMKPVDLADFDKLVLRKRSLIETVNDQLKNISQLELSRHRSLIYFMVNLVAGLIAYTWQPKKPSLQLRSTVGQQELALVPV